MNLNLSKLFLILVNFSLATFASEVLSKSPHHKGKLSSINVGTRYSSILENRGVVFYKDFQLDPILAIFLFDDRLEFLGDSIGYRDFVLDDRIRLRTRLVSITDKPLFPVNESLRSSSPARDDTFEWMNRIEFFFPGYNSDYQTEIDLGISKDLSAHKGSYLELLAKYKIFDFKVGPLSTKIEPNFFLSLGWGTSAHNQYFYGPESNSDSFNNLAYGFWFAFPEEADRFYPIIQVKHFEVLGKNKEASYAKNRNEGWLISFIATYGLLE